MKRPFKPGMTIDEIQQIADHEYDKLYEVDIYLNEAGEAAKESFYIIYDSCIWSSNYTELIANINDKAMKRHVDEKTARKLNSFIRNYLKDEPEV